MRYFYNFCLKDDDTALDSDILSGVRRGFFSDFQRIKDRITVNSAADSVSYEYMIEKEKPMKWLVTQDKTVLQDVKQSDGGKYYIYFYKDEMLYKRILFSRLHTLLRVEYFDLPTGLQFISLEPRKAQNGLCILYDSRVTPQPVVLYPMSVPADDRIRRRVEEEFDEYTVKASTDDGIMLFLSDEQEKDLRAFVEKAEAELVDEPEESFVADSTPLFDKIKAKDFNVKRNLATSLDITKAPEFSFAPEEPAAAPEADIIPAEEEEAAAVAEAAADAINAALADIPVEAVPDEPAELVGSVEPIEDDSPAIAEDDAEATDNTEEPVDRISDETDEQTAEEPADKPAAPDKLIMADGAVYSYYGDLDDSGNRSGFGRTVTDEGRTAYEGSYLNDKRSGNGSYYYKDGSLCYTGDWVENARHGVGVGVSSKDGSIHAGRWALNKPQGSGVRLNSDGEIRFVCKELTDGSTVLMNYMPDDSVVISKYDEKGKKLGEKSISLRDILDQE